MELLASQAKENDAGLGWSVVVSRGRRRGRILLGIYHGAPLEVVLSWFADVLRVYLLSDTCYL